MIIHFPFTAIVGMERAKRSLICHAIDPKLGGLLLLGHRGSAKSTVARAFSKILPNLLDEKEVPFVEIPLGTTEDRLLGSINTSTLLEKGEWISRKGLIEQANQGVLYIDEVNLLPDHLSDSILDSAASGYHRIERDGISSVVEARYILIGSMNPEEGDLRPQILDRFAHGIEISDQFTVDERVEIVDRRIAFDDDPDAFAQSYQKSLDELKKNIIDARQHYKDVQVSSSQREEVAQRAKELQLEGVRAELSVMRTARCLAAWEKRQAIQTTDIEEAWILCLGHRLSENTTGRTSVGSGPTFRPSTSSPQNNPPRPPQSKEPQTKEQSQQPQPLSSSKPTSSTSPAPIDSNPDNLKLNHARLIQNEALKAWWNHSTNQNSLTVHTMNAHSKTIVREMNDSRISWIDSFLASTQNGWIPGKNKWQIRYQRPLRRPNTWVFLDASRSTGATRFLADTRDTLLALNKLPYVSRFHILLLKDSKPTWILKRGTFRKTTQILGHINEAGGKSYLARTLKHLIRGIQRQGVLNKDRILLCSDGLTSPKPGESPLKARDGLRNALQTLTRFNLPFAWLHPSPKRGMANWIPRLTHKLQIDTIGIETSERRSY